MESEKSKYRIKIRNKAEKNLYKLSFLWRDRIEKAIDLLKVDPFYGEKMLGKLKGRRKIRVWPYRIIYQVYEKEKIIYIERIDHRGSIGYK